MGNEEAPRFLAANVSLGQCVELGEVGYNAELMWSPQGDEFWYIDPSDNNALNRRRISAPSQNVTQTRLPEALPGPSLLPGEIEPIWYAGNASGDRVQFLIGYYEVPGFEFEITSGESFANPSRPSTSEVQTWYEDKATQASFGDQVKYTAPNGQAFWFHTLRHEVDGNAQVTMHPGKLSLDYLLAFDPVSGELGDGFWLLDVLPDWQATGGHNINTFHDGYHFAPESCFDWHSSPDCPQRQRHMVSVDGTNLTAIEPDSHPWTHETAESNSSHLLYGNAPRGAIEILDIETDEIVAEVTQHNMVDLLDASGWVAYIHGDKQGTQFAWSAVDYGADRQFRTADDLYYVLVSDYSQSSNVAANTQVVASFQLRTDPGRFWSNTAPSLSDGGGWVTWSQVEGGGPNGRVDIFVQRLN